ncbi:MAG TPA: alpha-glucan family phosphorylase, partial [Planctomycetota bacterium]|nr:alpha-glucan family phosphorylase [Planctomycetota bacterium]
LLLDSRDEQNSEADRGLCARLYGGDQRTRIQQEILLGVGGARALRALGITASVFHLNEGHSAFAIIERARHRAQADGLPPWDALRESAAGTVFTTHTPVDAGHDRFPPELAAEHLGTLAEGLGLSLHDTIGLGRVNTNDHGAPFMPTVLALKFSRRANAVAALHGVVSRRMWQVLWPGRREDEVPIGHVTNGVHASTWLAPEMQDFYALHFGPHWKSHLTKPDMWAHIEQVSSAELWEVQQVLKARMIRYVRRHSAQMRERLKLPPLDPPPLDPDALTIGFARRFATYKRADLFLSEIDRLAKLVNDPKRPVNFVFAGRAHPADWGGKSLIQKIARLSEDPRFRSRVVFIEGYNIHVARQLVQGVDLWLNNPRRPEEACGTSGQKAILNGGLHCSILDGWWAEAYDGANGFGIGTGEIHSRHDVQDKRDADALYHVLENEVIPLYYDRKTHDAPPLAWLDRVKRSIRTLAWRFNADRMVMDYVDNLYLPAAVASSCRMPP